MSNDTPDVEVTVHIPVRAGTTVVGTIPVSLQYRAADPYAVTMVLADGDRQVVWMFGRDLLTSGLDAPAGGMDVRIVPVSRKKVEITMSSTEGEVSVKLSAAFVREFLARTTTLVPYGDEVKHLDMDAEVARLLDAR